MRSITIRAVLIILSLITASPVAAQTAGAQPADQPRWLIGATGGAAAVENLGITLGASLAFRASPWVDVIGEGVWFQDTATRRSLDSVTSLAAYLQQTQGTATTGTITSPAFGVLGGARVFASKGRVRPYFLGEFGVARVTLQPSITIGATDVTTRLTDYGVSLGSDLTGTSTHPVIGVGAGVASTHGRWHFDVGFHLFSIQTPDQTTTVMGARAGLAYGF